ncbi:S8 family peptidase [Paraburkholderia graminis]|uniref:S8 family peptidase n=1 Tax=Paraburkholderia graminis TaxID=60548 RepID=UPI00278E9990|nr:S8 family serine peptidase [Paraburkholderia graminis]MDQ0626012.1 subtilisin family serine protease [Paraburkholderia graminis]
MKQQHMILRCTRASTRDLFLGTFSTLQTAVPDDMTLMVEVDNLTKDKVSELAQHPDVVAIAPSVPMKLIEPIAVMEDVAADVDQITWGIQAVGATTSPFTGDGVTVAVIDTGIDSTHQAFAGVKFIEQDFTGEGNGDEKGHGTHCAGTIFGRLSAGGRIGVATGIKTALIAKVIGQKRGGSSEHMVRAIQWAVENGANVISMSLGIDFPKTVSQLEGSGLPPEIAASRALEAYRTNVQLFERLAALIKAQAPFSQPCIIVAAAGNESQRNKNADWEVSVGPPAVAEGIISVAAIGPQADGQSGFMPTGFSNTGATVAAPGLNIISAKSGGGFISMSGTSMATPHVAGVAALWAQKLIAAHSLNASVLTARLVGSATSKEMGKDFDPSDIGAGIVQAPQE